MSHSVLFTECDTANAGGASLFLLGTAGDDLGVVFPVRFRSGWHTPLESGGEAIFRKLWLTVSYTGQHALRLTPFIDGESLADLPTLVGSLELLKPLVALPLVTGEPKTTTFEIYLQRSLKVAGQEVGRFYLRGTRGRFQLESVGAVGAGVLEIDGMELEYEAAMETKAALAGVAT